MGKGEREGGMEMAGNLDVIHNFLPKACTLGSILAVIAKIAVVVVSSKALCN